MKSIWTAIFFGFAAGLILFSGCSSTKVSSFGQEQRVTGKADACEINVESFPRERGAPSARIGCSPRERAQIIKEILSSHSIPAVFQSKLISRFEPDSARVKIPRNW